MHVAHVGESFSYKEAASAGGLLGAVALTSVMGALAAVLIVPPLRYFLKKVIPQPGSGLPLPAKLCLTCTGTGLHSAE